MGLTRREGWDVRMADVLEAARRRPYELGHHDCLRVALLNVEALTGVALWPRFEGRYASRRQAKLLIARVSGWPALAGRPIGKRAARELIERTGSYFNAAFSFLFETNPVPVVRARRGDVVKYTDAEDHLGVCTGAHVAVLRDDGLAFVPRHAATTCWMIG